MNRIPASRPQAWLPFAAGVFNLKRGEWERPRRFERLSYRALAEGLISLTKAAELLRLPVAYASVPKP